MSTKSKADKIDFTKRVNNANRTFNKWYEKFKVEMAIRYFEGFQWEKFDNGKQDYTPYTVNLVYSTIRIKRASLLFDNPKFIVRSAPESDSPNFDPISSDQKANLKSIALNSWVEDERNNFLIETKMAAEDAFFGFGIIEVGYSATVLDNPNIKKPLFSDDSVDQSDDEKPIYEDKSEVIDSEKVFIKRIPFNQFRSSGRDAYILNRANWVGYFDYYDFKDCRAAWPKVYNNEKVFAGYRNVDSDTSILSNISDMNDEDFKDLKNEGNLCKIWKMWDFKAGRIFWWDETNELVLDEEEFDYCCLHTLVFDRARTGFLPIPPVFNWLSPQDEVNECSEQLRVHRRRANRKYLYDRNKLSDEDELQKLVNGPDGVTTGVDGPVDATTIAPLPMAPLDPAIREAFINAKDNFNIVTLTGSEQRGQVDRETATAANIKNQNAQQAEAEPKDVVAEWLNGIARSIIRKLAQTTKPFWVKELIQPNEHLGGNVQKGQTSYKQISGEQIEGEDFKTDIEISSISPIDNEAELQKLIQFLSIINQFPEVAISPLLVRTVAKKIGITDEAVIAEAQQMAQMRMVSMMQQAQMQNSQQQQPQGSPAASAITQQMTPPGAAQVQQQLQQQLMPK